MCLSLLGGGLVLHNVLRVNATVQEYMYNDSLVFKPKLRILLNLIMVLNAEDYLI